MITYIYDLFTTESPDLLGVYAITHPRLVLGLEEIYHVRKDEIGLAQRGSARGVDCQ